MIPDDLLRVLAKKIEVYRKENPHCLLCGYNVIRFCGVFFPGKFTAHYTSRVVDEDHSAYCLYALCETCFQAPDREERCLDTIARSRAKGN